MPLTGSRFQEDFSQSQDKLLIESCGFSGSKINSRNSTFVFFTYSTSVVRISVIWGVGTNLPENNGFISKDFLAKSFAYHVLHNDNADSIMDKAIRATNK